MSAEKLIHRTHFTVPLLPWKRGQEPECDNHPGVPANVHYQTGPGEYAHLCGECFEKQMASGDAQILRAEGV